MAKYTPKQFMQQAKSMLVSFPAEAKEGVIDSVLAVEQEFDKNFDRQGFFFQPWQRNKQSTIDLKGGSKVLHDSGKLRKSRKVFLTSVGGFGGRISYSAISDRTHHDYAALQQNGFRTSRRSKGIGAPVPARPFVGNHHVVDSRIRSSLTKKVFGCLTRNYVIGR